MAQLEFHHLHQLCGSASSGPLDFTFQDVWLQVSDHTIMVNWVVKIFLVQFFISYLYPGIAFLCHNSQRKLQEKNQWDKLKLLLLKLVLKLLDTPGQPSIPAELLPTGGRKPEQGYRCGRIWRKCALVSALELAAAMRLQFLLMTFLLQVSPGIMFTIVEKLCLGE